MIFNLGEQARKIENNLYKLDYDNVTITQFSAVNETFAIPEDGIITINWRNVGNSQAQVSIKSEKRNGAYIYLHSQNYSIPQYAWHECIVEKGDVLTCAHFDNVYNNRVTIAHYPFKK